MHLETCDEPITSIRATIELETNHIGKGCDRDTYSEKSLHKLCGGFSADAVWKLLTFDNLNCLLVNHFLKCVCFRSQLWHRGAPSCTEQLSQLDCRPAHWQRTRQRPSVWVQWNPGHQSPRGSSEHQPEGALHHLCVDETRPRSPREGDHPLQLWQVRWAVWSRKVWLKLEWKSSRRNVIDSKVLNT